MRVVAAEIDQATVQETVQATIRGQAHRSRRCVEGALPDQHTAVDARQRATAEYLYEGVSKFGGDQIVPVKRTFFISV